jgi:hypothetical protein
MLKNSYGEALEPLREISLSGALIRIYRHRIGSAWKIISAHPKESLGGKFVG